MSQEPQCSPSILMVRPAAFAFHAEAAESNAFAAAPDDSDLSRRVLREFDGLAERLTSAGVDVHVLEDRPEPAKPDAVFPNNWVSFHADGTMVVYPMATAARRLERQVEGLLKLLNDAGFDVSRVVDLSAHEKTGRFLEGTGSLVLDRRRRRAFANVSARTDGSVIAEFDRQLGYSTFTFDARDRAGRPIYHTNVLLSLGSEFALLCTEAVTSDDRARLIQELETDGRSLIDVSYEQMRRFTCNLIELRGRAGEPVIALSSNARAGLEPKQRNELERFGQLVDAPIPTIEAVGGGSVRCMIADIHLPRRRDGP